MAAQQRNRSNKLLIVQLPDDIDSIPNSLRNLPLPSVVVDSADFEFDTTKTPIISTSRKKRRNDLTCVVCRGKASGYNFNRITCHSCKEFFRRNALQPMEKFQCLQNKTRTEFSTCFIQFDVKTKCSRCRLMKCLELGMRKDFLMTSEQKLNKQKIIEQNRRRSNLQIENPPVKSWINEEQRIHLEEIEQIYRNVWQTSPSPLAVFSFEKVPDRQSAFIQSMNIDNFMLIRSIHFLRSMKDFISLEEQDRLTLIKCNLNSVSAVESLISFNYDGDLCHFDSPLFSGTADETAFSQYSVNLYTMCYGEEIIQKCFSIMKSFSEILAKDGRLVLLLMLISIFLKGWSIYEDQTPMLIDAKRVFAAQSKYTDLLFRLLLEKFSYDGAPRKMMKCVEELLKIQKLSSEFDPFVRNIGEQIYVNPLMKSLLHLS